MSYELWRKFSQSKRYREEFVAAQVKQGIPFQIRTLMKQKGLSQEGLAASAGISQGVVSRAANPDYGNLTLNTLIRIAAGFDIAFVGKFVSFSELTNWFTTLSEESVRVKSFEEEDKESSSAPSAERKLALIAAGAQKSTEEVFEMPTDEGVTVPSATPRSRGAQGALRPPPKPPASAASAADAARLA